MAVIDPIFYFSLTTITTLGLGSAEPTGDLRMIAGIESATGFLLISCSASKLFTRMNNV
ncbi:MAG: ion channel [Paraglaciecola polaris]|uniref:ion channel n=1 Tax=Paraglaciecola polaris TaxID=222814 RepID=UPI0030038C07